MSGIYILHVTDANNCSNSTTTSVIVHLLVGGSAPVIADNNNLNLQNNNIEMPSINSNNPEAQNNTVRLNIFPNPNKGKLNIDYYNSSTKKMTIEVFDILGIRICLKDYYLDVNNQCNTELDLTSMPKGLYLLRINNVLYKDRIIIQ